MNQKIEDLKLLLRNDRRIWAAGGFVFVALLVWILTDNTGGRTRQPRGPQQVASPQGMGGTTAFEDLIMALRNDVDEAKKERREIFGVIERTGKDLQEYKSKSSGIFETIVDKFEQLSREVDSLSAAMKAQTNDVPTRTAEENLGPDEIVNLWEQEPVKLPPPPEPQPLRVSVVAPGDSAPVTLLTGVNAPVDGTPYPVVFKLTGPIEGPDGSTLDLGEARLIAAAQGSESDNRALFRLTQLSIRHPNGRRSVVEIDGWVVGEDGVRGMNGRLIDKLGRLIAATATISALGALGERLDRRTNVVINRDERGNGFTGVGQNDVEFAAASAVTDATNRLGQVLLNRYESLVPVVEVLSGREVAAIFSKPAEIALLDEDLVETGSGGGLE